MHYRIATIDDCSAIYNITRQSIQKTYPKYYPAEVVTFFLNHHSEENIRKSLENSDVWILEKNGKPIATGACEANHITRVYVLPEEQGKGYGTFIMNQLELHIAQSYNKAILDASLPASSLYEHRGYKTLEHGKHYCENNVVLVYELMQKELQLYNQFSYNGRTFTTKSNTDNGEVSAKTIFHYHQEGQMLWAEYSGGEIVTGIIVGEVNNDNSLNFTYQHINQNGEVRKGKCHSIPQIVNGKLEMHETWQWTNGDMSSGKSVLVEL